MRLSKAPWCTRHPGPVPAQGPRALSPAGPGGPTSPLSPFGPDGPGCPGGTETPVPTVTRVRGTGLPPWAPRRLLPGVTRLLWGRHGPGISVPAAQGARCKLDGNVGRSVSPPVHRPQGFSLPRSWASREPPAPRLSPRPQEPSPGNPGGPAGPASANACKGGSEPSAEGASGAQPTARPGVSARKPWPPLAQAPPPLSHPHTGPGCREGEGRTQGLTSGALVVTHAPWAHVTSEPYKLDMSPSQGHWGSGAQGRALPALHLHFPQGSQVPPEAAPSPARAAPPWGHSGKAGGGHQG